MAPKTALTYSTPDIHGDVPQWAWVGDRLKHSGNGKTYRVTGFAWMGATDEWGFIHVEDGSGPMGVSLCRPMSHRDGVRDNGERRYEALT